MGHELFEMLTPVADPMGEDMLFTDADLRAHATEVINLEGGGLMGVHAADEVQVSFVVLSFRAPAHVLGRGGQRRVHSVAEREADLRRVQAARALVRLRLASTPDRAANLEPNPH